MASPLAPRWIAGPARSGKTTRLLAQLALWGQPSVRYPRPSPKATTTLVFAATGDNRLDLAERILVTTQGKYAVQTTTPLGFFQNEVLLYWPLLVQTLKLKGQFPLCLKPETEQELATRLWQPQLREALQMSGVSEYFVVRRTLDIGQLAALGGVPLADIPLRLAASLGKPPGPTELWDCIGQALGHWRQWCWERGLLTYSLIAELYGQHLLVHPTYQIQLHHRYRAILADDVEDYPAIARDLFAHFLRQGGLGAFTFNSDYAGRLGWGADPEEMASLASLCDQETLVPLEQGLGIQIQPQVLELLRSPISLTPLPSTVQALQTTSRSQLLRQTAETIIAAVQAGTVAPEEIAVIGPGLDAIAIYSLTEILSHQGIPVSSHNSSQPLISQAIIRALLTLLALVYPGLGRLLDRNAIAEMLVVLSQGPTPDHQPAIRIDSVRAGLLADYCFAPHLDHPCLLSIDQFPRWDRLGHEAATAYEEIRTWIQTQQQQEQPLVAGAIAMLDRASQRFLWQGHPLKYEEMAALRELMETAQHYWEVDSCLRQYDPMASPVTSTLEGFIHLLRSGVITADPYPVRLSTSASGAVTLATAFQYRALHTAHPWHFWLDLGSNYWLTGGRGLMGAPLFLRQWSGKACTPADQQQVDQIRLQQQLTDLLGRVTERLYLCHSDLAMTGQEQMGALMALVNAAILSSG